MGSVVLDSVNNTIFTPRHPTSSYTEAINTASAASDRPGHARSTRSSSTVPPQQQPDSTSTADRTSLALPRSHVPQAPTSSDHTAESLMSQRVSSVGSSTSATTGNAASSPASHGQPLSSRPSSTLAPRASAASTDAVDGTMNTSTRPARPRRLKVRDLQHIQSFATEDMGAFSEIRDRSRSRSRGAQDEGTQYEISEMKVEHIIEMVAGLLTKITSTNDQQHEHLHRQPPTIDHTASMSAQTSSVLAFHGKNIPSITILSYLSRINKYCPTSYEVFLSLLVYFDRMTERVNAGPIQGLRQATGQTQQRQHRDSGSSSSSSSLASDKMEDIINSQNEPQSTQTATPPASGSMEKAVEQTVPGTPHSRPRGLESPSIPAEPRSPDLYNLSHFFVVDSFNIHRLVIAGVTCASKFFSDIFYTNSRYAKVGGLPLPELNHLELQFLLLNDFRLSIPVEEIEAYGTMLVEFYAREVVAQQRASEAMQIRSSSESSADSASTVQAVA